MSEFTDGNANQVHAFSLQMSNLGLSRVTDLLLAMFKSGAWREFSDGSGKYQFLAGEFDYFLTQQGVTRDHVMHGVRDVSVKAELEEAMDERRTGEPSYRRTLEQVRAAVPSRPGAPIEPFGYSRAEGSFASGGSRVTPRPPLGRAPRTYRLTSGETTKRPNELMDANQRLLQTIRRLDDQRLAVLAEFIQEEQNKRREGSRSSPNEHLVEPFSPGSAPVKA